MKTKWLLTMTLVAGMAVTGAAYAGCGKCPGDKAADAKAEKCMICPKCGEVAAGDKCCKDAAKCDKCGLHKAAPGCCKLTDEQKKSDKAVEMACPAGKASCGKNAAACPITAEKAAAQPADKKAEK